MHGGTFNLSRTARQIFPSGDTLPTLSSKRRLTSGGQARAAGDELQEEALLVARVGREDVDEHADGARLARVPVVGPDALRQHARLPALVAPACDKITF